ncbi:hypothetical protein bAD24_III10875 [Burkholderia sp. AD24]|nr:hypothetical protein bAD24_III10875 [Burkholderia sp. AD24]
MNFQQPALYEQEQANFCSRHSIGFTTIKSPDREVLPVPD